MSKYIVYKSLKIILSYKYKMSMCQKWILVMMEPKRCWGILEYAVPKCAFLAYELFWAKGHWKPADSGKSLETGHKISFPKGNLHL